MSDKLNEIPISEIIGNTIAELREPLNKKQFTPKIHT